MDREFLSFVVPVVVISKIACVFVGKKSTRLLELEISATC